MTIDPTKVAKVKTAMDARYENKQSNKKTDISGSFTSDTDSYPTVQAVKTYVEGKGYISQHQDISGKLDIAQGNNKANLNVVTDASGDITTEAKPTIPTKVSDLTNDSGFLTSHQDITGKLDIAQTSNKGKNVVVDDTTGNITFENKPTIPTKVSDLTNDSGFLTTHQSLSDIGGAVTVEKSTSDIGENIARYVIKQGGSTITNGTIDIPKDFFVKSGELKTATVANNPVSGYTVGDKYIDFVINYNDDSATDKHMYILVSDLVEDTTYSADNTTLELSNGTFSVKDGGIGTTQLASGVVTSLGYADAWNSSAAKGITSTDITNWNSAGSSNLTISDVDTQINAALEALAEEINPTSS